MKEDCFVGSIVVGRDPSTYTSFREMRHVFRRLRAGLDRGRRARRDLIGERSIDNSIGGNIILGGGDDGSPIDKASDVVAVTEKCSSLTNNTFIPTDGKGTICESEALIMIYSLTI
ncbi:hypothetical protein ACH5RR_036944 [Cinchona calisaya]|uniref:Uncharacterized protein n=1 Tax=Cinchona calisaya TaxID=153742 RepID=A0ABD2Y9K7_9GENT